MDVPPFEVKKSRRWPYFLVALLIIIIVGFLLLRPSPPPTELPSQEGELPSGQGVELPSWEVGAEWRYATNGETLTVGYVRQENLDGTLVYFLEGSIIPALDNWASTIEWYYELGTLELYKQVLVNRHRSETTTYHRSRERELWPLQVGTRVEENVRIVKFYVEGPEWRDEESREELFVRVETIENLNTPAGEFTCFKLSWYRTDNTLVERRWYSPQVKNYVKMDDRWLGRVFELVSYKL